MTIDLPQINCPACAAARAEYVKPGRPCDQRGPDRRRPQHVPAGGKLLIPAFDDGVCAGVVSNDERDRARAAWSNLGGARDIAGPISTLAAF
jgi:hypothetical protein